MDVRRPRTRRCAGAIRWIAQHPVLRLALPTLAVILGLGHWAPWLLDLVGSASLAISAVLLAMAVPVALWGCLRIARHALIRWHLLRTGTPALARVVAAQAFVLPMPTVDDVVDVELVLEVISGRPPRRLELRERVDADAVPAVGEAVRLLVDLRRSDRARLAPVPFRPQADEAAS